MGKKPWKSTGFWGAVAVVLIPAVARALETVGIAPSGTQQEVAQLVAALVALLGRWRATEPLRFSGR